LEKVVQAMAYKHKKRKFAKSIIIGGGDWRTICVLRQENCGDKGKGSKRGKLRVKKDFGTNTRNPWKKGSDRAVG